MDFYAKRIETILNKLKKWMKCGEETLCPFRFVESGYTDNYPSIREDLWETCDENFQVKGKNRHYWFCKEFTTPKHKDGYKLYFSLKTGREGQWDAT